MAAEWKPIDVDYEARLRSLSVGMQTVNQHPLLPQSSARANNSSNGMPPLPPVLGSDSVGEQKFNEDDPLGGEWNLAVDVLDPLGAMTIETKGFVDPLSAVVDSTPDEGGLWDDNRGG